MVLRNDDDSFEDGRYAAKTRGILVLVEPQFLQEHSDPANNEYVWAYSIEIRNQSEATVQLKTRHWVITDGMGKVENVRGPGVVGEQPILQPGDSFQYSSGCPLNTPSGFMVGTFSMVDEAGAAFDVAVPAFALDLPDIARTVN